MIQWNSTKQSPYRYMADNGGLQLYENFVNLFGFDKFARRLSIKDMQKFLACDKSFNSGKSWKSDFPPFADHIVAFHKTGTTRRMFVYHPYWLDEESGVEKIERWCNERDLIYMICPKNMSFYFPGNTYMILLMTNETYIDCLSLSVFPQILIREVYANE